MEHRSKNGNIVHYLCNRESGSYRSPKSFEKHIERQAITSELFHYEEVFRRESSRIIIYDNHRLHFNRYSTAVSFNRPQFSEVTREIQTGQAEEIVVDAVIKNAPYPSCRCNDLANCLCFRTYYVLLTFDQWLLMCDWETGHVIREKKLQFAKGNYEFSEIFWRDIGGQIFLHTHKSPNLLGAVVKSVAVFHPSLKFQYMFEVTRKVFGTFCRDVFVKDHFLVTMSEPCVVKIYSLDDVLQEGVYCVDEDYTRHHNNRIRVNLKIKRAPPVLFEVLCYAFRYSFGGFPFCCLYPKPRYCSSSKDENSRTFTIQSLSSRGEEEDEEFELRLTHKDEPVLHPTSNMVVVKKKDRVQCYERVKSSAFDLVRKYQIQFNNLPGSDPTSKSVEKSVLAFSIESTLNLIAVLGTYSNDPSIQDFIKIYDGSSGKELKTIALKRKLNDLFKYKLFLETDKIVMVEKEFEPKSHAVTVFGLKRRHGT